MISSSMQCLNNFNSKKCFQNGYETFHDKCLLRIGLRIRFLNLNFITKSIKKYCLKRFDNFLKHCTNVLRTFLAVRKVANYLMEDLLPFNFIFGNLAFTFPSISYQFFVWIPLFRFLDSVGFQISGVFWTHSIMKIFCSSRTWRSVILPTSSYFKLKFISISFTLLSLVDNCSDIFLAFSKKKELIKQQQ